jgi:hypothetical protein
MRSRSTGSVRLTRASDVSQALPFATQQLDKHGEFFPYGVALDGTGEVRMVAGDPGEGEQPSSTAVLTTTAEGPRRDCDSIRAVPLVADVRLPDSDAGESNWNIATATPSRCSCPTRRSASAAGSIAATCGPAWEHSRSRARSCRTAARVAPMSPRPEAAGRGGTNPPFCFGDGTHSRLAREVPSGPLPGGRAARRPARNDRARCSRGPRVRDGLLDPRP